MSRWCIVVVKGFLICLLVIISLLVMYGEVWNCFVEIVWLFIDLFFWFVENRVCDLGKD